MVLQETFIDRKLKILVIGDDANSRSILRKELQTAHCDTITAENGEEGLCLAATIQPDLILLDVKTPLLGGFALCQQLRNNPATGTIPVIFLTGMPGVQEIITGMDFQSVDYVVKPYTLKELQARIQKAVAHRNEHEKNRDEIERFKDNFVSMMSEELRRPVTVITGLAQLLEQKFTRLEPMVQIAYLREIIQQADDLNDWINDFRYLVHFNLIHEEVDVIQVVQSALEKFRKAMQEKGQQVILKLPRRAGLFVQGDDRYLSTAVKYLLSNAHKFTNPGGIITVAVIPKNHWVRIEASDTGIGSPSSQKYWILEKDYQTQQSLSESRNETGLGFMIAKSVAEKHRGSIGIESRRGQGSRFWLDLPINGRDYSFTGSGTRY